MSSDILFASSSYEKYDAQATLPAKFDRLLDETGLDKIVSGKVTAIKMHVGRGIGYTTIHPLFVKSLIDKLKKWGAKGVYNGSGCGRCAKQRLYGRLFGSAHFRRMWLYRKILL